MNRIQEEIVKDFLSSQRFMKFDGEFFDYFCGWLAEEHRHNQFFPSQLREMYDTVKRVKQDE